MLERPIPTSLDRLRTAMRGVGEKDNPYYLEIQREQETKYQFLDAMGVSIEAQIIVEARDILGTISHGRNPQETFSTGSKVIPTISAVVAEAKRSALARNHDLRAEIATAYHYLDGIAQWDEVNQPDGEGLLSRTDRTKLDETVSSFKDALDFL